jgi:hypothetical protein
MQRRLVLGLVFTIAALMLIAVFLLQLFNVQPPPDSQSLLMTSGALDQTAAFYATIYPTQDQPQPSYTAFSPDCGSVSQYECNVDGWRSFRATATSFAETAQPLLTTPTPNAVP